jgi:hypothetical protein
MEAVVVLCSGFDEVDAAAARSARSRSIGFRAALAAIAFLVTAPVGAAIPGQPQAADVKVIETCVADAQQSKNDPGACIGRVYGACQKASATLSSSEECFSRERLVWDAALERDLGRLSALLADDSIKTALHDVEREFAINKLKQCTFDRIAHKNSPDALIAAGRCNTRATARHDLWLLEEINSFSN